MLFSDICRLRPTNRLLVATGLATVASLSYGSALEVEIDNKELASTEDCCHCSYKNRLDNGADLVGSLYPARNDNVEDSHE